MKRISLLILSLLFFATAFQSDKIITQGWYQQFLPNLNGGSIVDITFLDSLTGFAVSDTPSPSSYSYILKTTNGGDNWIINYNSSSTWGFRRIISIDSSTIFAVRSYTEILKTTNKGVTWEVIPLNIFCDNISIINKDTMLVVSSSGFDGGVYRTTNGGYNWQAMGQTGGTAQPKKIFMVNKDIGFVCQDFQTPRFRRTSNGGFNWIDMTESEFNDMTFIDSIVGWKINGTSIKKTTNGGLNWTPQILPANYSYYGNSIYALNKDTIWAVGGTYNLNGTLYGMIHKTTNGGINWGYQLTDTSVHISRYFYINFVNKNCGWAHSYIGGIHTKIGGNDTTFFTGIKLVPDIVPEKFSLGQNYPNPFNPTTNIPFELKEPSHVTLKVFDARGREVKELVNGRWGTGKFIADFDASALATGIYFYQIIVSGETTHQTFTETKKLMVLK